MEPSIASGSRMNAGEWSTLMVSCAARPGAMSLRPPEKPRHEVLLDEAEGDVQVGLNEFFLDEHRRAAPGRAQSRVRGKVAGEVVDDAILAGDALADDGLNFSRRCGPVQAGGDEDGDAFAGNSAGMEALKQRRKCGGVGRGAGDVADGDGRSFFAAGQFGKRRGADGVVQRVGQRRIHVGQRGSGARLKHPPARAVRKIHRESRFAKGKFNLHGPLRAPYLQYYLMFPHR